MTNVAALWEELNDLDRFEYDVVYSGGSDVGGVPLPFLSSLYPSNRLIVQIAFGADLTSLEPQNWNWYDVTTDVRQADGGGINISPFGRSDEFSQSQPAGCTFQLANDTGAYSAYNGLSKWYPYVRRNTPVRVLVTLSGYAADLQTLFQGNITGWPPSWDRTGQLPWVTVSASGSLRQLAASGVIRRVTSAGVVKKLKNPVRSALFRAVNASNPTLYWACEDASGATSAASSLDGGGTALRIDSTNGAVKLAGAPSTSQAAGSDVQPDFSGGGSLIYLSTPVAQNATAWTIEMVFAGQANDTHDMGVLRFITMEGSGSKVWYELMLQLSATPAKIGDGGNAGAYAAAYGYSSWLGGGGGRYSDNTLKNGTARHVRVTAVYNADNNIDYRLYLDDSLVISDLGNIFLTKLGTPYAFVINPGLTDAWSGNIQTGGHLAYYPFEFKPTAAHGNHGYATQGYLGERADTRIIRLASEEGVTIQVTGSSNVLMGAQGTDTFVNLLRECETADDGVLYDGMGAGISYLCRRAQYNQSAVMILDATQGHLGDPLDPIDDDQRNRNTVKVERKGGSSITYQDATGDMGADAIGNYEASVTINTSADTYNLDRAQWEVGKGTVPGFRYPTLILDLAAHPELVASWLQATIGSRIDETNLSSVVSQLPAGTISVLLEGWSMFISQTDWIVTGNCSPYRPYQLGTLGSYPLQTAGTTLTANVLAGASSFTANVTGRLWSTSAGDYPLTVDVSGIQVTVTAVSGVSSPQTFTVDPTTVVKLLPGGSSVKAHSPIRVSL